MRGKAGASRPLSCCETTKMRSAAAGRAAKGDACPHRASRSLVFPALHRTQTLLYLGVHLLRLVRDAFRD